HDDLPVLEPRLVEQRQRHPRGLAGAGRRHQHRGVMAVERARQFIEHGVDRERGVEGTRQLQLAFGSSPLPLWERVAPSEVRQRVRGKLPQTRLSYAGLTRVSITLRKSLAKEDGLPGQARQ